MGYGSGWGHGVMARPRLWSSVAGNDYNSYPGIGPVKAMDICLRKTSGRFPTLQDVTRDLVSSTSLSAADVTYCLETSRIMCVHPVVYSLEVGQQQHMCGCSSTQDITQRTGKRCTSELERFIREVTVGCWCRLYLYRIPLVVDT